MSPAIVSTLILAVWLFISAFVLPHAPASQVTTWLIAVFMALFGLLATRKRAALLVDGVLGVFLFIATLVFPQLSAGTLWNNIIVAVLVCLASVLPFIPHRKSETQASGGTA